MTATTERDPLVDPRPGDVLDRYQSVVTVTAVEQATFFCLRVVAERYGELLSLSEHEWRRYMRDATVLYVAQEKP